MTTIVAVVAVAKAVEEMCKFLATPAGQKMVERGIENGQHFEATMRRLFPKLFT